MDLIDEAIQEQTEVTLALKRIKMAAPTQYNVDRWSHQSRILNEMCDIRARRNEDRFVKSLDKNKNAIYRPVNEQDRGQIRCLDNEHGERITDPKGVGDILAEHLSKKVLTLELDRDCTEYLLGRATGRRHV